jgi:SAM-dependent methyltransferase
VSNEQQIEFWNGHVGQRFVDNQDKIDQSVRAVTDALMELAAARPGERALDIGCGAGPTTLRLAEAVGATGHVVGVDVSRPLLEEGRRRLQRFGSRVELVEADAAAYQFGPEFDLGVSRFGIMFFDAPERAFTNIARAFKPNGRLAFACWQAPDLNPWMADFHRAAAPFLPPPDAPPPADAPGPFAFADGKRVERILWAAGFRDVQVKPLTFDFFMGATIEDAADQAMGMGPPAMAAADEATRAKIRVAVLAKAKDYLKPAGVVPPAAVWLVAARA